MYYIQININPPNFLLYDIIFVTMHRETDEVREYCEKQKENDIRTGTHWFMCSGCKYSIYNKV